VGLRCNAHAEEGENTITVAYSEDIGIPRQLTQFVDPSFIRDKVYNSFYLTLFTQLPARCLMRDAFQKRNTIL
jgi:hypothetical protein